MRFHRSDLPGLVLAVAGPVGLMLLFLASFEAWDHHGTPLLGAMAGNLAVGGGLLAAFTRFIRRWDWILGFLWAVLMSVVIVILLQQTDHDGTAAATAVKWVGVVGFLGLNVLIPLEIINNGLIPLLNRNEARRAAESES